MTSAVADLAPALRSATALDRARHAQLAVSDPFSSAWVSASAGTGKTKVLVDRVLRLLLEGVRPNKILCLTYTRAAAAEMAERIERELSGWAGMPEAGLSKRLHELRGRPADSATVELARSLFPRVLEWPGGLHIHTLHAFCQAVLKRFPVEAEVPPHFAVLDDHERGFALRESQRSVIERVRMGACDDDLAAALALTEQIAGEIGLTAVLKTFLDRQDRLRPLFAIDAAQIREMLRASLELGPGASEAAIVAELNTSPHEKGLRRVAEALLRCGPKDRANGMRIAEWLAHRDRRSELLEEYLAAFFTQKGARRSPLLTNAAAGLVPDGPSILAAEADRLDVLRSRLHAARCHEASWAAMRLGIAVQEEYRTLKRAQGRLDFHDLIERSRLLLESERPGLEWVLFKLDGGIDHILLDEAQDTSPDQWRLIERLSDEFFAGSGAEHSGPPRTLFVVGDFKQSIFSFQGAAPAEFIRMREWLRSRAIACGCAWQDRPLDVSFRSLPVVLEIVDAVFATAAARSGVAGAADGIRHLAAREARGGIVEVWPLVPVEPRPDDPPWGLPVVEDVSNPAGLRLANAIAERIASWLKNGERLTSQNRELRAGDIMILVRRRTRFMAQLVRALKMRDVPVAGVDVLLLSKQLAVRDLVALGRFLLMPEDDLTLATVLKGPLFDFDDDGDLFPLAHDRGGMRLWWRLKESAAGANFRHRDAYQSLSALLARADFTPPFELFADVLEARGGRKAMLRRLGRDCEDALDEFLELALAYQREHVPSLQGFLHWFDSVESEIRRDTERTGRGQVRVLTVHGAKGLQAPVVFVADTTSLPPNPGRLLWGAEEGEVPFYTRQDSMLAGPVKHRADRLREQDMAEHRRLLYVALTRAADRLYISGIASRNAPENTWYGLVCAALSGREKHRFSFGEDWSGEGWRIEEIAAAVPRSGAEMSRFAATLPEWAKRPPQPEAAAAQPLNPSRAGKRAAPLRSPAVRRGRLIHRLLEFLPGIPDAQRAAAAVRFLAASGMSDSEADAGAQRIATLLKRPELAQLFGPTSMAEVPLAGLVGEDAVSGQIDRLSIGDKEILVLDYKTDSEPPCSARDVPLAYLRQMAAYRALLRRIFPRHTIVSFLLWTEASLLMLLTEEQLDRAELGSPARLDPLRRDS